MHFWGVRFLLGDCKLFVVVWCGQEGGGFREKLTFSVLFLEYGFSHFVGMGVFSTCCLLM